MTDREMLEMAARAAGVCLHPPGKLHTSYGNWGSDTTCTVCGNDPSATCWNPLADDGDALRLAVKLRIDLALWIFTDKVIAKTSIGVGRGIPLHGKYTPPVNDHIEPKGSDPYAATRRAIVRAAAEIGRQMEEQS